jgi:acyl-CoA reductase-like NAD-dependent aldehyde dehydrogenase
MTNASSIKCGSVREEALTILSRLDVPESAFVHGGVPASSPITGEIITDVHVSSRDEVAIAIGRAACAFSAWRTVPAPHRGEFVRTLAEEFRASKDDLGRLVTLETGKIISEGLGEVQEMIDICDFAVGLSRNRPAGARLPRARARARQVVPISDLVFGALTQNRSSLEDRTTTRRCHRASGKRRVST